MKKTSPFHAKVPAGFDRERVRALCRCAHEGNPVALALAWHAATDLAETILEIAKTAPERLDKLARNSRFMPAVLSTSNSFNNVVRDLPRQLALSADCPAGNQALRLDVAITKYVVERYEAFETIRRDIQFCAKARKRQHPKENKTERDYYLMEGMAFDKADVRFLKLRPLSRATIGVWWERVFLPLLNDPDAVNDSLLRKMGLLKGLENAAATTHKKDRKGHGKKPLDIFKERCKSALNSLAKS